MNYYRLRSFSDNVFHIIMKGSLKMTKYTQDVFLKKVDECLNELDSNYASFFITDYGVGKKVEKFAPKPKQKISEIQKRTEEFLIKATNINKNINDIKRIYKKIIEDNFSGFFTDSAIKYKSLFELSKIKAFEECHEKLGIDSREEWDKLANNNKEFHPQKDAVQDECYRVNKRLQKIDKDILSLYLNDLGIEKYSLAKIKHKNKNDNDVIDLYSETDILFLIECLYDSLSGDDKVGKQWSRQEERSYGRSFLSEGKGALSHLLRVAMTRKFDRLLYLDAEGRQLLETLFVFPKSMAYDVVWETESYEYICNPFYWFMARESIVKCLEDESTAISYPLQSKKGINYKVSDYCIADAVYWELQFRRLEDLCLGLKECYNIGIISRNYPQNADLYMEICEKIFMDGQKKNCIKNVILKHWKCFEQNKEDSVRKKFDRNIKNNDKIFVFYMQGLRCYRNVEYVMSDLEQSAFLEIDRNSQEGKYYVNEVYIRSVLMFIIMLLGSKKIFPLSTGDLGKENKKSLKDILNDFDKITDVNYKEREMYYLPWIFLNEILEWGFYGAKVINKFRMYHLIPCYRAKGVGLINNTTNDLKIAIPMEEIRKELLFDYENKVKQMCSQAEFDCDEIMSQFPD